MSAALRLQLQLLGVLLRLIALDLSDRRLSFVPVDRAGRFSSTCASAGGRCCQILAADPAAVTECRGLRRPGLVLSGRSPERFSRLRPRSDTLNPQCNPRALPPSARSALLAQRPGFTPLHSTHSPFPLHHWHQPFR